MSSPSRCQDNGGRNPSNSGDFPHGAWPSPLRAADVAAGAVRRTESRIAGGWAYWVEERPLDRGRGAVVRVRLDESGAQPAEVPHTTEADIRTCVHEYGGGAWLPFTAPDGGHFVLGSCMSDHRIRLFDVTGRNEPHAVTPEPDTHRGCATPIRHSWQIPRATLTATSSIRSACGCVRTTPTAATNPATNSSRSAWTER